MGARTEDVLFHPDHHEIGRLVRDSDQGHNLREAYGGKGKGNPNHPGYSIVSHFWKQKNPDGTDKKAFSTRVPIMELGGNRPPEVLATQGVLVGGDDLDRALLQSLKRHFGDGATLLIDCLSPEQFAGTQPSGSMWGRRPGHMDDYTPLPLRLSRVDHLDRRRHRLLRPRERVLAKRPKKFFASNPHFQQRESNSEHS